MNRLTNCGLHFSRSFYVLLCALKPVGLWTVDGICYVAGGLQPPGFFNISVPFFFVRWSAVRFERSAAEITAYLVFRISGHCQFCGHVAPLLRTFSRTSPVRYVVSTQQTQLLPVQPHNLHICSVFAATRFVTTTELKTHKHMIQISR